MKAHSSLFPSLLENPTLHPFSSLLAPLLLEQLRVCMSVCVSFNLIINIEKQGPF